VLSSLLRRPSAWALLLALSAGTASLAARLWPGAAATAGGLAVSVEVARGDAWQQVASMESSLPLQRDLAALRARITSDQFRATWSGVFLAARAGDHQLYVASDDGARVWIDGHLVVDNGGRHARLWRSGVRRLERGPHQIRVEYEQWGGDAHLETWLRQPGGLARRLDMTRRQFAAQTPPRGDRFARALRDWLPWIATVAGCAAYLSLLIAAGTALFRTIRRWAGLPPVSRHLALSLTLAAIPMVWGLWWGLPADVDGWAPDELTPERLTDGIARGFVAPWASIYPPLHFFVLTPLAFIVDGLAGSDGWSSLAYPGNFVLHAAMRGVSVLMALGSLAWLWLIVRLHGSEREGTSAVVVAASCSSLLYYAKMANVDVPYLYWMLAACACVAAVGRAWSSRLVLVGAVAGACAIGTKDQAAGFLLLMPAWLVALRWRDARRAETATAWRRTFRDPVWWQASLAAAATLTVIYLLPLDWTSVARHLAAARRGTYAPMVPATPAGQARLLLLELDLLTFMLGIPAAMLALGGALWSSRHRPGLGAAIGIPILAYVGLFLPVIRYTYDRFLLGVALLLACVAGPFALWLWQQRRWRAAVVVVGGVGVFYTAGHAISANVLMTRDSRYVVERVLAQRAAERRELVGLLSPRTYLPRTDLIPVVDLQATVDDIRQWSPDVLVFERGWMNRPNVADRDAQAVRAGIQDGTLGYRRLDRWQSSVPWWAFQARPAYLARYQRLGLTNLDKVNPQIELWGR
jgi:hypothetical protein